MSFTTTTIDSIFPPFNVSPDPDITYMQIPKPVGEEIW